MTQAQLYAACVTIAPNFTVQIIWTTLPTVSRSIQWFGRPKGTLNNLTGGIVFPENSDFEPKLTFVLTQALAVLQQAG
jgi:hypothetical protein